MATPSTPTPPPALPLPPTSDTRKTPASTPTVLALSITVLVAIAVVCTGIVVLACAWRQRRLDDDNTDTDTDTHPPPTTARRLRPRQPVGSPALMWLSGTGTTFHGVGGGGGAQQNRPAARSARYLDGRAVVQGSLPWAAGWFARTPPDDGVEVDGAGRVVVRERERVYRRLGELV